MLVRRVKERLEDPSRAIRCIGTSATMASEGDEGSRQAKVAQVASTLFAADIAASSVVTETLVRSTDPNLVPGRIPEGDLRRAVSEFDPEVARDAAFRSNPLMAWIEMTLGLVLDDDGTRLRIVDYELSGNNDPCFDLGNTAQEAEFDDELRAGLCESYFGRSDPQQLARMNLFALMSDVGWTLWGAIQAKISTIDYDFNGYYSARWDRALAMLESNRFAELLEAAASSA